MSPSQSSRAHQILTLTIKDKNALYAAYMPFISNGGLFIPTSRKYQLGDEVFMLLTLMEDQERIPVAGAVMLNKAARGADGALFVTDSRKGVVWRLADGRAEEWLTGLTRPNALHLRGGTLFVGVNGDGTVRSIDLATRASRTLARFGPGILVGMDSDAAGNLLVSQVEGRVFRIAPDGTVTRLLDTSVPGRGACNFAYVPEQGLLVVPTWTGNAVAAYSLATGADPDPRPRSADGGGAPAR